MHKKARVDLGIPPIFPHFVTFPMISDGSEQEGQFCTVPTKRSCSEKEM